MRCSRRRGSPSLFQALLSGAAELVSLAVSAVTVPLDRDLEVGDPGYEGRNSAHRKFFSEFKYLNAYYYLFLSAKAKLQAHLVDAVAHADRIAREHGRTEARALAVVTHAISSSQFQAVVVPRPDAAAMATNFDGFLDAVSKHCIVASHCASLAASYAER